MNLGNTPNMNFLPYIYHWKSSSYPYQGSWLRFEAWQGMEGNNTIYTLQHGYVVSQLSPCWNGGSMPLDTIPFKNVFKAGPIGLQVRYGTIWCILISSNYIYRLTCTQLAQHLLSRYNVQRPCLPRLDLYFNPYPLQLCVHYRSLLVSRSTW